MVLKQGLNHLELAHNLEINTNKKIDTIDDVQILQERIAKRFYRKKIIIHNFKIINQGKNWSVDMGDLLNNLYLK